MSSDLLETLPKCVPRMSQIAILFLGCIGMSLVMFIANMMQNSIDKNKSVEEKKNSANVMTKLGGLINCGICIYIIYLAFFRPVQTDCRM